VKWLVRGVGIAIVILLIWVARDLSDSTRHDLRHFDGHEVGRLETAMWQSYYSHERLKMYRELAQLLREQYRLPLWRSYVTAYYAAHAAVVFQRGRSRAEYVRALPDLQVFYAQVLEHSAANFDAKKAAQLELEWWIVHRERALHKPEDLANSLAELQSEIYQRPASDFLEHARARAAAMLLRDRKAESGSPSDEDWRTIAGLLDHCWMALQIAVAHS